jgi:hypothetical protein
LDADELQSFLASTATLLQRVLTILFGWLKKTNRRILIINSTPDWHILNMSLHNPQPENDRTKPRNFFLLHLKDGWILFTIVMVALVNGLLYVFIVPPWQHYDEPNHFEYAWLIANRNSLPHPGDYDLSMRREVGRSMIDNGFFKGMGFTPDLNSKDTPAWIGEYPQLDNPPLYYLAISLPLRFLRASPIDSQLYAARLVSWLFYILSIVIAWALVREISSPGTPMRWLVPLGMALLPAYSDLMTAVNSDVGAVLVFSLFLWGAVRLIKQGVTLLGFLWVLVAAALCYWTKNTVWFAIPLLGLGLFLALMTTIINFFSRKSNSKGDEQKFIDWPARFNRIWWIVSFGFIGAAFILICFMSFSWGDAAYWYGDTAQTRFTRTKASNAPLGDHALQLEYMPGDRAPQLLQLIPTSIREELRGKVVTLGGWVWADRPLHTITPILWIDRNSSGYYQEINVGDMPTFYTFSVQLEQKEMPYLLNFSPLPSTGATGFTIYYDGWVMLEGEWPVSEVPHFITTDGNQGTWGSKPFTNLLRGASGEKAWPRMKDWVDLVGSKLIPDHGKPSLILYTILDYKSTANYYWFTSQHLLRTFWAKFGWAHVSILGHKPYRPLFVITLLGLLGIPLTLLRHHYNLHWRTYVFLGFCLLGVWGITFVRGAIYLNLSVFFPAARYAYPAIIPTISLLTAGWLGWARNKTWNKISALAILFGFMALNFYSLISIWIFYRS